MAVVALIAAHRDPEAVAALARALAPWPLLVHIDAETPIEPFRGALRGVGHARLLEDRVRVHWAGWSQVEVALRLMRTASADLEDGDHAVLLSGDSFPLQTPESIARWLDARPDHQMMSCVPWPVPSADRLAVREFGSTTRLSRYRLEQDREPPLLSLRTLVNRLEIRRPWRRALGGRALHGGGQWWALSGAAIRWLLDDADRDRRFRALCRTSAVPDEFFLPTLLMNSPHASRVGRSPMYTDWTQDTGWSPALLTEAHLDRFEQEGLASAAMQDDDFLDRHARIGLDRELATGERTPVLFARKIVDPEVVRAIRGRLWTKDLLGP